MTALKPRKYREMENNILKVEEVASLLRLDKQRVYELVRRKQIPVVRVGERQYRFSKRAIEDWLDSGGTAQITSNEDASVNR
jgi:excisionase family DNA binding protein